MHNAQWTIGKKIDFVLNNFKNRNATIVKIKDDKDLLEGHNHPKNNNNGNNNMNKIGIKFFHLHQHSIYSSRDGLASIKEIIETTKNRNESAVITDHGSIGSWINYYNSSKNMGVDKPVFGVEGYISKYRDEIINTVKEIKEDKKGKNDDIKEKKKERQNLVKNKFHIIIIAKNTKGFYNIIDLMNDANINGFYQNPMISQNLLLKKKEGLIVTTACIGGTIGKHILNKDINAAKEYIELMKEELGEDFYLEVQANGMKEQKIVNKFIMALSKKFNVKVVLGTDAHYITKDDADTHQDMLLLQGGNTRKEIGLIDTRVKYETKNGEEKSTTFKCDGKKQEWNGIPIDQLEVGMTVKKDTILEINKVNRAWIFETDDLYIKELDEIKNYVNEEHPEIADSIDEIIQNTVDVYNKIENIEINFDNKLPNITDADKIIIKKIKDGLSKKKDKLHRPLQDYINRIKFETDVIKQNGFSTYFLILADIVDYCKDNKIAMGSGRGSSVGSLVSYLLDITRIDPFDPRFSLPGESLPFERFLNTTRNKPKYVVKDKDGNEVIYYEGDIVKLKNGKEIKIENIKEGDEIV